VPEREFRSGGPSPKHTGDARGHDVDDPAKRYTLTNDQTGRVIRQIGSVCAELEAAAEKLSKR